MCCFLLRGSFLVAALAENHHQDDINQLQLKHIVDGGPSLDHRRSFKHYRVICRGTAKPAISSPSTLSRSGNFKWASYPWHACFGGAGHWLSCGGAEEQGCRTTCRLLPPDTGHA